MKLLLAILSILVIADGVVTNILVEAGIAREVNPLMQPFAGSGSLILVKLAGAMVCSVILLDIYRRYPGFGRLATACLAGLYGLIVIWNLGMLLTA